MLRLRTLLAVPLLLVAILIAGLWLGGHPTLLPGPVRNLVVEDERALRAEVIASIQENFNRPVDREQLEQASLEAMVRSLGDRYSHYFSPVEAERLDAAISNEFEGIGVSVEQERRGLRVLMVFEGAPASNAGLRKGDVITGVDGDSIAGEAVQVATAKITGPPGTSVRLEVVSGDERRTVRVKRARIEVPAVTSRLVREEGGPLGVVELMKFTPGVHGELRRAADGLLAKGAEGLVLDMRGNSGGLLDEAVLVSSQFVEDGVIVRTKGRTRPERSFEAEGDAIPGDVPLVVLVDSGSASAAEIVTGALRDYGRGTLVGERTFGKGVFQEVDELSNGGALSLTAGSYFLPKGENISGRGIQPAVKAVDDPDTDRDEALPVALDVLRAKVS
jgi:carboxyl-terminal processing protease